MSALTAEERRKELQDQIEAFKKEGGEIKLEAIIQGREKTINSKLAETGRRNAKRRWNSYPNHKNDQDLKLKYQQNKAEAMKNGETTYIGARCYKGHYHRMVENDKCAICPSETRKVY